MRHPQLPDNDPIEIPKAVAGGWEGLGWVALEDQSPKLPPEAPTPATEERAADPAPSSPQPAPGRARSSATTEKE